MAVVSAPSGAGKTTLCREATRILPDLHFSVSLTTRPPRPEEVDGQDYRFVGAETFQAMVRDDQLLEYAEIHGAWYGTPKEPIGSFLTKGEDVILAIDHQGARALRQVLPSLVTIYLLPPSLEILATRLQARRTHSPAELARRLERAREEISHYPEYIYLIVNEKLDVACQQLTAIIMAERARVGRADRGWIHSELLKPAG